MTDLEKKDGQELIFCFVSIDMVCSEIPNFGFSGGRETKSAKCKPLRSFPIIFSRTSKLTFPNGSALLQNLLGI